MRRKVPKTPTRVLLLVLVFTLLFSVAGCGTASTTANTPSATTEGTSPESASTEPASSESASSESASSEPASEVTVYKDQITIECYLSSANYAGIVGGWFDKKISEKFNMKVNVISPNISGDAIFQTRSAAGNLGDLIYLGSTELADSIKAGLVMDITDLIKDRGTYYMENAVGALDSVKSMINVDKYYAIPTALSSFSPLEPIPDIFGAATNLQSAGQPFFRFDLYQKIGSPKMDTLDDLLPTLKKIQDLGEKSDSGKKMYALELWKSWDGSSMMNASGIYQMYGYTFAPGTSSILSYIDGTKFDTQRLDDDNGFYHKALEFLYKANQMGLIDPDSPTQEWDSVLAKVKDGQNYFGFFAYTAMIFYNNPERGNAATPKGFEFVPITDQKYYAQGYNPNGAYGSYVAIGSKAKDPERLMDLLNWIATPEGNMFIQNGPKGLKWEEKDGKPVLTEFGKIIASDQTSTQPVPESFGGGTWKDGVESINYMIMRDEINPDYGVPYSTFLWPSFLETATTGIDKAWQEMYKEKMGIDYVKTKNMLAVVPGSSFSPPADPVDIKSNRAQCGTIVKNASWQMVFASDEAQFDKIWEDMKEQIKGNGWDAIVEYDQKLASEFDAVCKKVVADAK